MAGHDRQLREARSAYLGAVRTLDRALRAFDGSDIPMDPGVGDEPIPWTPQHTQTIRTVAAAFRDVVERRRSWDWLRRDWQEPH